MLQVQVEPAAGVESRDVALRGRPGDPGDLGQLDHRRRPREPIASSADGVDHVVHEQPEDVAQALITLTDGADMVVLPARRRSVTMTFLRGSNAMRVIAEAHCPVVTVESPA
ncbi:universal stress protein [Klenkia sp. LSe6-5]|uniref:Universal stress protein n=1 Tax=Klenkia sesuvii TaxID=3103137 RepID=A0ABU8DQX0_9ACTN